MKRLLSLTLLLPMFALACGGGTDTPDAGGSGTPDAANTTPDGGGSDTPDAGGDTPDGSTDTPDGGSTDTPDAGPVVEPWVPAKYTGYNGSGTRLKAHAITDANGNSVVAWFEDTTLGVRCTVREIQDGRRFCLPEAMDVESHGDVVYTDAGCTTPALRVPSGCTTKAYATWRNFKYYELGDETSATTLYAHDGFGCGQGGGVGAGQTLFALEAVDYADFVEFPSSADTLHAIDAAVAVRVLHGTDGSMLGDTLVHRATNRPARPVEIAAGDVRLVEKNPFPELPMRYERYSCDVTDTRYANAFVAPKVDPVPAFVEVAIAPPSHGANGPRFLRVTSTQTTYCTSSNFELTVTANQLVYVLGAGAADLSGQPVLKTRAGAGTGTNLVHYLTANDVPVMPRLALDQKSAFGVSGTAVRAASNGSSAIALPANAVRSSWEELFSDASCSVPAAPASAFGVGDVIARVTGSALGGGACKMTLPGSPDVLASLWQVKNEAPTNGHPYALQSVGGPQTQCVFTGMSMGGPPPPPMDYRSTNDVTSQAATVLPALSTTRL